jgi:hypothetical protein
MDKRESDYRSFYAKSQGGEASAYGGYVEDRGGKYMVPYQKVRRAVFAGVSREELRDPEHAARLQYRLLLMEPVLAASVDFDGLAISLVYNPEDAVNRNEKISLRGIADFLAGEGVHVDAGKAESKELDYYRDIYEYYNDPKTIRERPPYSYTLEEWKKGMKEKYEKGMAAAEKKKLDEFGKWRAEFEKEHPELLEGKK